MITNSDWLKPKEKPYFHQISLDCIEKLVKCIERFNKGEIDSDSCFDRGNGSWGSPIEVIVKSKNNVPTR
jgi:hypothetical protein